MEKKCCKNGMNVFFCGGGDCGCQCACEPEPEPTANVEVTVGETGDFKTLREAQQYIRQRACNRAVINLVSDVKEEAGTYIAFNGFSLDPITIINGNKHTLDLSNITGEYGLSVNSQRLRLQNIKIYAPNTTFAILGAGNCAQLHMFGDVIVQGGGVGKTPRGIHLCFSADLLVQRTGNEFKDCAIGVDLNANSSTSLLNPLTFTNVTTEFSPAKNTLGNKNSYVAVNY